MAGNSNRLCDQIQRWLLEVEDNEDDDISSESEEGGESAEQSGPLGSPHHSDTEQDGEEDEDEDEDVPLSTLASYQSRNGTKWSKIAPPTSRTRSHNILVRPPGPCINGLVIYQMNNPQMKVIRRQYLQEVGFDLARPSIERRISQQNIPRGIKLKGRLLLGLAEQPLQQNMPIRGGVGRCAFCSRARDRSTRKQCSKCMRRICSEHQAVVCPECMPID